ncbi:MAG: hypothetical protein ABW212_09205 [Pseudonocardia sediminis]
MPGLFGLDGTSTVVLLAVVVLVVVAALSRPGRRAAAAGIAAVGRWPGLIRSELRGAAPLERDAVTDTTPDIPPVTRGLPIVERPDRGRRAPGPDLR